MIYVFAAGWPLMIILVAMCSVDWNEKGGL
jgi:hypothetical protein